MERCPVSLKLIEIALDELADHAGLGKPEPFRNIEIASAGLAFHFHDGDDGDICDEVRRMLFAHALNLHRCQADQARNARVRFRGTGADEALALSSVKLGTTHFRRLHTSSGG